MPNMKSFMPKKLKIKYKNQNILEYRVKGDNMTREEIKDAVKQFAILKQNTENQPVQFMIALSFPEQFYSGEFFRSNQEPNLFSYNDYDSLNTRDDPEFYPEFYIYVFPVNEAQGGTDKNKNDCLFICLQKLASGALPWNLAGKFKTFLGLKRTDKVSIELIPTIEEKLKKYAINVTGDYVYTSSKKSNLTMNLKLIDGHYKIDNEHDYKDYIKSFKISTKSRTPLMIYRQKDCILSYDGEEERELNIAEYCKIKNLATNYIYVPYTDEHIKKSKRRSLKECFEEWKEIADTLYKETNGMIDMTKTGSFQNTGARIFQLFTKTIHPEAITQHEAIWINNATRGAIIHSEEYNGPLYSYDFVSEYPSVISSSKFFIPVKQGTFEKLDKLDCNKLTYGIYRCIIKPTLNYYKVFKLNSKNYYTSIDVKRAYELGYDIELIQDDQPNALKYYRDSVLLGSEVFGKVIQYLFELKQKKVKGAKQIISSLWGKLSEVKKYKKIAIDEIEIEEDATVYSVYPSFDRKTTTFQIVKNSDSFKTNYARIKPFVLAFARYNLSKAVEPIIDYVVKSHTDSIYTTKAIKHMKLGNELGELKYNGYCENAVVTNKNSKLNCEFKI